jgi:hypothetical protein
MRIQCEFSVGPGIASCVKGRITVIVSRNNDTAVERQ